MTDNNPINVEDMLAAAGGDRDAFGRIILREQDFLLNFFRRLGASHDIGEDLTQETFVRLYRWRKRYTPTARFTTFLFTLARHVWIDWLRKQGRRINMSAELMPEVHGGNVEPTLDADLRLDLQEALNQLPETHRAVVVLSVFQGLSYAEIGTILEIPEGTVKSRMFHTMRKLREQLGAQGYENEE